MCRALSPRGNLESGENLGARKAISISVFLLVLRGARHNQVHGITPSVAKAAAVGDSLLEGVNGVFKDGGGAFQGRRGDDPEDLVSWTGATLPPDQVIS